MWWTRHYSLTIYNYWTGPFHQGMWWTRHYLWIIYYYYWARPIPLRNVSSPVGWDTAPSGSNRFCERMFQSVTSDFHHWFNRHMELAETKVVPAGEQPSKTCEEEKEGACTTHQNKVRFILWWGEVLLFFDCCSLFYGWVRHYYLMLLTGCSMGMNKKIWRKMNLSEALRNLH